jgi:hypothetical protein
MNTYGAAKVIFRKFLISALLSAKEKNRRGLQGRIGYGGNDTMETENVDSFLARYLQTSFTEHWTTTTLKRTVTR